MAKIILPKYPAILPSSGKTVSFRPFTVKEEKSLLLALQEGDAATVTMAIKNVIDVCTDGEVNPDEVPYYDVEFLYMQIRSKSIGEVIDLVGSCDCSPTAKTPFSVDIADIQVLPAPSGRQMIKIPDTPYTVEFDHPTISDFSKTFNVAQDSSVEVVANCMKSVFTEDEVLDWSMKEKMEFVESMTSKQQKDMAKFLDDMPMVKLPVSYKCCKCGELNQETISGMESFFV